MLWYYMLWCKMKSVPVGAGWLVANYVCLRCSNSIFWRKFRWNSVKFRWTKSGELLWNSGEILWNSGEILWNSGEIPVKLLTKFRWNSVKFRWIILTFRWNSGEIPVNKIWWISGEIPVNFWWFFSEILEERVNKQETHKSHNSASPHLCACVFVRA